MKTIREEQVGKATVRLLQKAEGYVGLVIQAGKGSPPMGGDDPDALWRRLIAEVGKAHPSYFGFDGAMARFRGYFPNAFEDPGYAFEERTYKDQAVAKIAATLPIEAARAAGQEHCLSAVRAFQATNLVYQVEKARIHEVLAGPTGPAFVRASARFADGEFAAGVADMVAAIRAKTQPSWPMLTYLPFMWRPDRHMFLKPVVTCDFADRVGHPFARDYREGITAAVYESLLDLAAQTEREIAALKPKDLIDVQSFIWVVGAYKEDERVRTAPA